MINNMTDNQIIYYALRMWMNHIQTGDVNMTPGDAEKCGQKEKIKALSIDQMKGVVKLDELSKKFIDAPTIPDFK